jgi:hypothetical protein
VLRATFSRRSPHPFAHLFRRTRPSLLTLDNQSSVASSPDPFSRRSALSLSLRRKNVPRSLSLARRRDELAPRSLRRSPFVRPREAGRKITGAVQSSWGLISLNTLTVSVIV